MEKVDKDILVNELEKMAINICTMQTGTTAVVDGISVSKEEDHIKATATDSSLNFESVVKIDRSTSTLKWVTSLLKWVLFINFPNMENYDIEDIINKTLKKERFSKMGIV